MIVAIEGIDGSGKNTLVTALQRELGVAVIAFPRYAESAPAQLAQAALYGKLGDVADSAYAMATLFALDRHGAIAELSRYAATGDVVVLDRYVASNAAYSWARTGESAIVDWVADLEFGQLGLPEPNLNVLLATPPAEATRRARRRADADASRARDVYERDRGLQERTAAAYAALAERQWHGPWLVSDETSEIVATIERMMASGASEGR